MNFNPRSLSLRHCALLLLCLLFSFTVVGCSSGSSETENATDRIAERDQVDGSRNEGENLGEALNELGDALKGMGEAFAGEVKVEPVDWRDLAELYPRRIRGLEQSGQEGEKSGAMGFKVATVKRTYTSSEGDQRLEISLVDLGSMRGVARVGLEWLNLEIDREDNSGFERTTKFRDHPMMESCDKVGELTCEVNLLVSNRFVISMDSRGLEIDKLRDILADVKIDRLEELHDFGVSTGV